MRTILEKNKLLYTCVAFVGIYTAFMTCVSPASAGQGLSFFFYLILAVFIPGTALIYFLKLPVIHEGELIAWGGCLGEALIIIQYFLLAAAGLLDWVPVLQCVISLGGVAYLLYLYVNRRLPVAEKVSGKEMLIVFCFVTLNLVVRFFTYYGQNLLPEPGHNVVFPYQDILFYIGNAISAGKAFPVQEFRFSGQEFRYHYFGSLLLEMASKATGIPELILEFCFSWALMPFLLITGFWCLMRRMKISGKLCILGEFLLLFTAGWELIVYIAFQAKMYITPFGYDVGLTFAVFTIIFMLVQHGLDKMHFGVWGAGLLSFALCTGAKAPVAVILLVFLGGICSLWLFKEKKAGRAFIYGISFVAIFLLLFFTVVSEGMATVSRNQTGLYFSLTGHLYECGLGKAYYDMVGKGVPGVIGKVLILLAYLFGTNPAIYGLFCIALFCKAKKGDKRAVYSVDSALVVSVAAGMVLTLFTKQSGNSQMYFAMTAVPFAILYVVRWFMGKRFRKKGTKICFGGVVLALLLLSVGCWFQIICESVENGWEKLAHRDAFEDVNNSVTWEEYEAYRWVHDHTEENAVMLCNIAMNDALYDNFTVGVCTERQMWIEGWRYVEGYLDRERIEERRDQIRAAYLNGKAAETAEEAGAGYLIWIKRFNPEAQLSGLEDRKLYDNGSVAVYQMNFGETGK